MAPEASGILDPAPGTASAPLQQTVVPVAGAQPAGTRGARAEPHRMKGDQPIEDRGPSTPGSWLLTAIAGICASETRTAAAQRLVSEIARGTGAVAVRVAWGKDAPQRIVDSRFGVVATGEELYAEMAERWRQLAMQDQPLCLPDALFIPLHGPAGAGRAVMLVLGGDDAALRCLPTAARALAAALWSRPVHRSWIRFCGRYVSRRWVLGSLFALLVVCLWPCHYRIACSALVEPVVQRVVAAPFEATLADCFVVPGDVVRAGQPLLVLDGRPLRIEFEALEAELQQAEKNEQIALATGRIADAQLAGLERRRLERRRTLLEDRLQRLTICSPVSGVVLSGDHRRSVGAPLVTGQSLLEIAPLDQVTLEVEIPEEDVCYAKVGQPLDARLNAYRASRIEGKLETLCPAAEIRDDRNAFIGTVTIPNPEGEIRPGMRGDATLYGPVRPYLWSWLRPLVEQGARMIGI